MSITLTLIALIFSALFSGIAIFEKVQHNGKLSMSTKISLIFFCLMLITSIADDIAKDQQAGQDKQELLDRIDKLASSTNTIKQEIDSTFKTHSDTVPKTGPGTPNP